MKEIVRRGDVERRGNVRLRSPGRRGGSPLRRTVGRSRGDVFEFPQSVRFFFKKSENFIT